MLKMIYHGVKIVLWENIPWLSNDWHTYSERHSTLRSRTLPTLVEHGSNFYWRFLDSQCRKQDIQKHGAWGGQKKPLSGNTFSEKGSWRQTSQLCHWWGLRSEPCCFSPWQMKWLNACFEAPRRFLWPDVILTVTPWDGELGPFFTDLKTQSKRKGNLLKVMQIGDSDNAP